jgi:hypothetical protein
MDVKELRFPTPEAREQYMNARAIAERCAAEVPADYRLEDILWESYPPSWEELLAACGVNDATDRYLDCFEGVRDATSSNETRERNLLALDAISGENLAGHIMAYSLFGNAFNERQQRESRQLTAEDLARALVATAGKYHSEQQRAAAILKG